MIAPRRQRGRDRALASVVTLAVTLWIGRAGAADRTAGPTAQPPETRAMHPASASATRTAQAIRGDDVLIEGKLYSPQALFILSRAAESFDHDAIVPHTLRIVPTTSLAPYRVQIAAGGAAATVTADEATTAPVDSMARDEH